MSCKNIGEWWFKMIESTNVVINKKEKLEEVGAINLSKSIDFNSLVLQKYLKALEKISSNKQLQSVQQRFLRPLTSERGDVPGWVLVVLMTTGLVTAIWTIAAPRLTSILKNSLDAMNGIR